MSNERPIQRFTADKFTDFEREYNGGYGTAKHKAKFALALARFVISGFDAAKFTPSLYNTLNGCFGHIAHYNRGGFYHTWFADNEQRLSWLLYISTWRTYGDPKFTYTDVEAEFKDWLINSGIIEVYQKRVAAAQEASERATLAALKAKYEEA